VLERRPAEARRILEESDRPNREQLLALLRLASELEGGGPDRLAPEETAVILRHLDALAARLRGRAELVLDRVCFCRRIESFGRFDPWPADRAFQAGTDGQPGERVQVYAEVGNFHAQVRGGLYETVLCSRLEIYGEDPDRGRDAQPRQCRVVDMNLGGCVDRSRTPRHDYFLNFQFHVPARLRPGLYTLWVTVKDSTPGAPPRVARRSLDFRIVPPRLTE
jgi:hypothetical protein